MTDVTVDQSAQAVQALFKFLGLLDAQTVQTRLKRQGNVCSPNGSKQPFRAIQEPQPAHLPPLTVSPPRTSTLRLQQARKAAEAMDLQTLTQKLNGVHCAYNTHGPAQGMDEADFLHLLADCQLFNNRFGLLEGQVVYKAALEAAKGGYERKPPGLSMNGLTDALQRLAVVKLSKANDKEAAFHRVLSQWVLPNAQQGPGVTPFKGLMTPVSMDMLGVHDAVLKKMFAWYASLPNLAGPVSWEQFKHNQKGMMSGHLILLLTDFKVIPGMLSVRQVTGLLQQYNAEAPAQDGVLQYPQMLDLLCRCAVLLRQQVQRKLSSPWVNITELNSLKRYLKLQSLPSLQDAYALPDSPHHMATLTSGMHKMQLASISPAAQQSKSRLQHRVANSTASHFGPHAALHASMQRRRAHTSLGFSGADGAASNEAEQHVTDASRFGVGSQNGGLGEVRSPKRGWDDSGISQHMQNSFHSSVEELEEERYWEEQDRMKVAEQQQQACKVHLAWREADKRRLLQHRKERLSYDPRMPARLASFPCHMPCKLTPPYAVIDPAASTITTALNADGDGWSPMVDVVRLDCPSPTPTTDEKMDSTQDAAWVQLPMRSLQHVPLESLSTGISKLGKRRRDAAWSHDISHQLASFDSRLPGLLASWSIEKERQQWNQTAKHHNHLEAVASHS